MKVYLNDEKKSVDPQLLYDILRGLKALCENLNANSTSQRLLLSNVLLKWCAKGPFWKWLTCKYVGMPIWFWLIFFHRRHYWQLFHNRLWSCWTETIAQKTSDKRYGNMGCQVSKGGIQNSINFWPKINIRTRYCIL